METVILLLIGISFILIGISNRRGNVSMLHSYHRKRVTEEDKIPFGKMVGLGMIIIGGAMLAYGGLLFASTSLNMIIFAHIGNGVMALGFVSGSFFIFKAMKKYNKGIF